jgi:hypothetical protein
MKRPSVRSTITTVAAATVLVGGANLAAYAATGSPLVLGHVNRAVSTTSIKNTGHGPALSLRSGKHSASLKVNSTKMVKHLNADTLHGVAASVAAPKNYRVTLAKAGGNFAGTKIVTSSVPAGTYQITLQGAIVPSTSTTVQCFVGDRRFLTSTTPDISQIWAVDFDPNASTTGATINAVGTAAIKKHVQLFVACIGDTTSNQVLLPVIANFTQVNGIVNRHTTVMPIAKHLNALAAEHLNALTGHLPGH